MTRNIRLLEKRVKQAVERLQQLSTERERLDEELKALRQQLESLESEASERGRSDEAEWVDRRAEVVSLIRETLTELRPD
jgi:FtsZ-binding cell division protein ZapB